MTEHNSKAGNESAPDPDRRRWYVTAIVVLASVLAFVSIFAVWVNRQALDTDHWTSTSSQLLENKKIRDAVATYLVDELYANVNVAGEIKKVSPSQADANKDTTALIVRQLVQNGAGPAAEALRGVVTDVAKKALASSQFQSKWEQANNVAHKQLLTVLNGGNEAVSTQNGVVTLNLGVLVRQIGGQLGIGDLADKIPADTGNLQILKSDQLDLAQKIARLIRHLALILPIITVLLYALAVFLAHGRRRTTLRAAGIGLVIAAVMVLLARGFVGSEVVNSLATTQSVKPAAEAAWSISTSLLVDIAVAMIVMGLLVVLAAWIAGPMKFAVRMRRGAAPYLNHHLGVCYGVAAAILLLLVIWGPTTTFRSPLGVLFYAVLLVIGIEFLRREIAKEFPDETLAAAPIGSAGDAMGKVKGVMSKGASSVGGAVSKVRLRSGKAEDDKITRLERLGELKQKGLLTDEEFETEKTAILRSDD